MTTQTIEADLLVTINRTMKNLDEARDLARGEPLDRRVIILSNAIIDVRGQMRDALLRYEAAKST